MIHRLRTLDFWRHPVATVRRWRWEHRFPRPTDFDNMTPVEFETYIRDIGFDAQIAAALAESDAIVEQTRSDGHIPVGQGGPER